MRRPARECRGQPHPSRLARGTAPAEIWIVPQFARIANGSVGHRRIDSLAVQAFSNPLCAARNLKSAGEDYLGVVNTRFVPSSASTINFPRENGVGL